MIQGIFDILWKTAPAITILLFVALLTAFITYMAMKLYSRFRGTENTIQLHDKDIVRLQTRADNTEIRLTAIETKLDMLIEKVKFLTEFVISMNRTLNKKKRK